ncbi:MAG: hypothetical protein ACFCGT_02945 [Sandaracinaceae bacterium]
MPKAYDHWKVLPHLPLEPIADNAWRLQGSLEGMGLKRVMTIARRSDGGLVVHNPIAVDDATREAIEGLGEVAYLVVPNGYHRLDTPAFKARYPDARVVCPPAARRKVEEVVAVDLTCPEVPADDAVSFREVEGIGGLEWVMVIRSADGVTLVFNDLIFNVPHGSGLTGFVFRYLTDSTGGPKVSRVVRWFVMKDRKALKADLERLAETEDLRRIVVSHHRMIDDKPREVLKEVAARL